MRLRFATMILSALVLASLAGAAETARKTTTATTATSDSAATSGTLAYRFETNILYRDATAAALTDYQKERCRLDVYHPENRAGFPTVVWFHGGGLTSGERAVPEALKNQGIGVVAVNYRLSPKAPCRDAIDDAAAAVAWTFNNIARYGGATDRVYVSGHSAGGYLTLMIGLDKRWLANYDVDADRIAALIPFSGHAITHMTIRKERGIPDTQPIVDEYAPLYHVRADAPPLVLLTGDREKEMLGRYEENAYLMRMLKVAGHKKTTLIEFPGTDHGSMQFPAFGVLLETIRKTE